MTNVSFLPLTRVKRRQSKGGRQKKATINEEEGGHTAEHCGRCLISQRVSRHKQKRTRKILTLILALIFGIGATSELRFLWATPDAFIPLFPYLGCSSNSVWKGGGGRGDASVRISPPPPWYAERTRHRSDIRRTKQKEEEKEEKRRQRPAPLPSPPESLHAGREGGRR